MARTTPTATTTARTTIAAAPRDVMAVLTEPDSIRAWSPIPFELEDLDAPRLRAGARARVSGSLVGRRVAFDVDVLRADGERLELVADGPLAIDVAYDLDETADGCEVTARVAVHPSGGLLGRVLAHATAAVLAGGALDMALNRIAGELELEPALALAA